MLTDPTEKPNGTIQVHLDWKSDYMPPESSLQPEALDEEHDNKDGVEVLFEKENASSPAQVASQDKIYIFVLWMSGVTQT